MGTDLALQGLWQGAGMGLAAVGFSLIFLTAKELHFAYGVTIAAGGYIVYLAFEQGIPVLPAVVLAVVGCAAFGGLVRHQLYRRLGDHFAVLLFSFGLAIIVENGLHLVFGAHQRSARYAGLDSLLAIGGRQARWVQVVGLGLLLVVLLTLHVVLRRTRLGIGLSAVMKDAEMAELVGVRTERMRVLVYVVGSGLAGLAGSLRVVESGVSPASGFELLLFGVIATLLAGDSPLRAGVWGLSLGVLLSLSAWPLPAQYQTLVVFGVIVLVLYLRMRRMPLIAI